jgi:hypothetical protein
MRPGLPDPLIELLGARWSMGAPVVGAAWLGTAASAAFGLADGTVALARASWDGAAQVQPREGGGAQLVPATAPPPPVMRVGVHVGPCLDLVRDGADAALSGGADGRFARIGLDGTVETLASFSGAAVSRVASGPGGARACVAGQRLHRFGDAAGVLDIPEVAALAFDPAGSALAVGHAGGVTLWSGEARALSRAGRCRALAWSSDGRALMSGLDAKAAQAWMLPDGTEIPLGDYPQPPASLSYSDPGKFFATSGGTRVVCWHLDGGTARRSECGVGSTAAVTQVACHPGRPLVATGYDNGAVLLCQPDVADLLFVRMAGGGAVSTLAWSADGGFLALGTQGGEVGAVAFPDRLFRAAPAPQARAAA